MALLTLLLLPLALLSTPAASTPAPLSDLSTSTSSSPRTPVPLEIHIMSQCPDALVCWKDLISPALDRLNSHNTSSSDPHYTFQLSFIGRTLGDGSIVCMHGETECLGNMLHLCAAQLSSPPQPAPVQRYKTFSDCLLKRYHSLGKKEVVEECVRKNQEANVKDDDGGDDGGHDGKGGDWTFEDLNKCVSDYSGEDGGAELLRKSVERSEKAGIKRSCTVRVKGEVWCVRDGGEWKDCPSDGSVDALVGEIERLWHGGPAVIEGGEL